MWNHAFHLQHTNSLQRAEGPWESKFPLFLKFQDRTLLMADKRGKKNYAGEKTPQGVIKLRVSWQSLYSSQISKIFLFPKEIRLLLKIITLLPILSQICGRLASLTSYLILHSKKYLLSMYQVPVAAPPY